MTLELINLDHLSAVRQTIEGLADIKVSIYDSEGTPLLASTIEDSILSSRTATETEKEEYNKFINDTIKTTTLRRDISISKAPSGQYYFFIPYHINETSLVLVGGAFFLSLDDFKEFISKSANIYSPSIEQIEASSKEIQIMDYGKIQKISLYIQKLLHLSVKNVYENRLYKKKYSRTKTILRLLSKMEEDISQNGIYTLMSDILIYHFNVDSLSFMVKNEGVFKPIFTAGRLREQIDSLNFKTDAWAIAKTIKEKRPTLFDDPVDMQDLMLNKAIESIYLFPCFSKKMDFQLLCLFNTTLSREEEEELSELYQHINFIATTVAVKDNYCNRMREMTILNLATSGLNLTFNDPEVFYNSIVETAVRLSKAERGSLMLVDSNREELSIKAVHGINKWLLQDSKVMLGEGIAGKVFKESLPVISKDIEKDFSIKNKPNYKTSSFISIPLNVADETIGVLNVSDKTTGEIFQEEDLALIRHFANYASIALKGSNYYNLAERMKKLSITDPLTELFNRRYFQDRLTEEIVRSERHSLSFSLCLIDIDDFKLFNDSEGHPAGDDILKRLSQLIHDSLRTIDVLARIGGEEFAVIMPRTDKNEAYHVAERVKNRIKQKLDRTWKSYPKKNITVSIGISTFSVDGNKPKKLIGNADKALYRAKMHGKDKTFVWQEQTAL